MQAVLADVGKASLCKHFICFLNYKKQPDQVAFSFFLAFDFLSFSIFYLKAKTWAFGISTKIVKIPALKLPPILTFAPDKKIPKYGRANQKRPSQ